MEQKTDMNVNDLRVVKTKNNIENAFLSLLQEKKLNEITIKDICYYAQCSRNTFYLHYGYKEALFNSIVHKCITGITDSFSPIINSPDELSEAVIDTYIEKFLKGILKQRTVICIISKSDMGSALINQLSSELYIKLKESSSILSKASADSDGYQLFCKYTAHGFVAFSIYWLNHTNLDFEEAKYILRNLMYSSMKSGAEYLLEKNGPRRKHPAVKHQ